MDSKLPMQSKALVLCVSKVEEIGSCLPHSELGLTVS